MSDTIDVAPTVAAEAVDARRARFRAALAGISNSSSSDLIQWVMLPASIAVIVGFNFMVLGWWGASHTHREIEQIPYLISGGIVGLALVFLGGLMLTAVFWVVVVRKLLQESEARTHAELNALDARLEAIAGDGQSGRRRDRASTPKPKG